MFEKGERISIYYRIEEKRIQGLVFPLTHPSDETGFENRGSLLSNAFLPLPPSPSETLVGCLSINSESLNG